MNNDIYIINDYQNKKTFSSFLSAIAGKHGVPMWSFYVNRGQLISSFGTRDKNGAILEFFPANAAYQYTNTIGFRTFVKVDNNVYEFFKDSNPLQTLMISRDKVKITEINYDLNLEVSITYHTLPNESSGGLVRKVVITNHGKPRNIEVIDGLAQILPAGIDYGGYKAVSNLLQSWMQVEENDNYLFYKLRASTDDSSEVNLVNDGNYYFTVSDDVDFNYIYDLKNVFGNDSTLSKAHELIDKPLARILESKQVAVNQVPSAFSAFSTKINQEISFISLIGYAEDKQKLSKIANDFDYTYLNNKELENKLIHDELVSIVNTKTAQPLYDEYIKQNLMDNVLRGGIPLILTTKDGIRGYHIYSRKHGDLERDYNFFSIEPKYYSQGNGNFRDVLQNRRNDLLFFPEIKDSNLIQFASLIQADGYNPLSIEGMKFKYEGKDKYPKDVLKVLENEFTPGDLATVLEKVGLPIESNLTTIVSNSKPIIKAAYGEGYWEDHFTYLDDIIDSLESIYPDEIKDIAFNNKAYQIFNSNVYVKPRNQKYVLTKDNKIRQYDAVSHNQKHLGDWLLNKDNQVIKLNLVGKLLTLIVNKFAHLDPYGIGLSYEANKPGWNDAMNGLPGIFASGVSETIELLKIAKRTKKYLENHYNENVYLLRTTNEFIKAITKLKEQDDYSNWDHRMTLLEFYRLILQDNNHEEISELASSYLEFINLVVKRLEEAVNKAKALNDIIPTYLTYEVDRYEKLDMINQRGEKLVKALSFKLKPVASFLEAPARFIKATGNYEQAKGLYNKIKQTELYDNKFKFYKTSVDLTQESSEIGRIHAFTKGWFERESNFLHMTYKYLLGILKSGLYDEFYEEMKTNYTCFMDPNIYGRSPLENSSFIAPSNNPDYRKQGQGFVARLTGSTSEVLSMWQIMFFGPKLFEMQDAELTFKLSPKLHKSFFEKGIAKTTLFSNIEVEIINHTNLDTYDPRVKIEKIVLEEKGSTKEFVGNIVTGPWVKKIRNNLIYKIKLYFS